MIWMCLFFRFNWHSGFNNIWTHSILKIPFDFLDFTFQVKCNRNHRPNSNQEQIRYKSWPIIGDALQLSGNICQNIWWTFYQNILFEQIELL